MRVGPLFREFGPIFVWDWENGLARKNKDMTLVAASKPQLKKRAKRDWSKQKAKAFLDLLEDTCNVSQACRESGVPMTVAYRRRKMDAGFRAEWLDRIAIGYLKLEGVLLDRAFNGTERVVTKRDGSEERMREYPNHIALKLLQMHRETAIEADQDMGSDEIDEIRERIVKKLQRMKKRDEEQEAERDGLRSDATRESHPDGSNGGGTTPGDR